MRRKGRVEIVTQTAPLVDPLPWFLGPEEAQEERTDTYKPYASLMAWLDSRDALLYPQDSPAPKAVETRSYSKYLRDREEVFGPEGLENTLTYKEWAEYWAHASSNQV